VRQDIPSLLTGDIVECHVAAVAHCDDSHNVGTYASEDGGTYVLMTPPTLGSSTVPATYGASTAFAFEHAVVLSFFATVTTGGTYSIEIKGNTNGSNSLRLTVGSWLIRVTRP
jgi:hypothetical protein